MFLFKFIYRPPQFKAGIACAIAVLMLCSLPLQGLAQTSAPTVAGTVGPLIVPVTTGRGPGEQVVRFKVAPNAADHRYANSDIDALAAALISRNRAAARAAGVDLGIKAFGLTQGSFAALGTIAEHAAFMSSFSRVNNALNNIGLVMAIAQVSRDALAGNTSAAVYGGLKAMMNYAIGRWGSSALQIAGVATFVIDVTLSEWQAGLTDIGKNVWTCRYRAYYKAHGMKVSDWKVKALELYKFAEKQGNDQWFNTYLDGAINEYVQRAFNSGSLELYSECGGSSFGDTEFIQRSIEAEHKGVLEQMMVEKVLPEITEYAWQRTLLQQVSDANAHLKPELNRTFLLEVTAYGAPEGARIVMPLPNGGEWGGKLRADGTFRAKLTYFALMKAGFPDTVRYESGDGSETRSLVIADGRMTTSFGTPNTPVVVRYQLEEGEQTCTVRRIRAGQPDTEETQTRPARPPGTFDMAVTGIGTMYLGRYSLDPPGWSPASPGRHTKAAMLFGSPYHDDIQSFENCRFEMLENDRLAEGACTIERLERKAVSDRTTIQRICISPATFELIGIFASMGGQQRYFAMDTPEGKAIVDVLRMGLTKVAPGGGAATLNNLPLSNP